MKSNNWTDLWHASMIHKKCFSETWICTYIKYNIQHTEIEYRRILMWIIIKSINILYFFVSFGIWKFIMQTHLLRSLSWQSKKKHTVNDFPKKNRKAEVDRMTFESMHSIFYLFSFIQFIVTLLNIDCCAVLCNVHKFFQIPLATRW